MSQPKNKFLVGYGIVTALGAGILGYLWYSASDDLDTAKTALVAKQSDLTKLESAPLFPNDENSRKKTDQVNAYTAEVDNLHNALVGYQRPLNPTITPEAVGANLGKYKTQLEAIAKGRKIDFPASGIDLGLGRYLTTAPKREATPQLDYLVDSVNGLLNDLFRAGITKLNLVNCPELAYEKDANQLVEKTDKKPKPIKTKTAKADPKAAKAPKEEAPVLDEHKVFNRYRVYLTFTGTERATQEFLNGLTTAGQGGPFWIINALRVDNEKKDGPQKKPSFQPQTPQGVSTEKDAKIVMVDTEFVLGNEKLTTMLDLDLVRFLDPSIASAATDK